MEDRRLLLKNGMIRTLDGNNRIADALVVERGKIVFSGSVAEATETAGKDAIVLDLEGATVLPGFVESHLHPPGTADTELFRINLYDVQNDVSAMLERVTAFIDEHPDDEAYWGAGFSVAAFTGDEVARGPRKEHLDAICPGKPIYLTSYDGHIAWVNSAALQAISAGGAPPASGRLFQSGGAPPVTGAPGTGGALPGVEYDPATGEPWGSLKESALKLMPQQQLSADQRRRAMLLFQERMHRWGYTTILNMSGRENAQDFDTLDAAGELKLRVRSAVALDPDHDLEEEFALLEHLRNRYRSPHHEVTTAKFFADGVVEGATAFLLEPYETAAGRAPDWRGEFLWDQSTLTTAFGEAYRRGFHVHIHSIGDGSTRCVLNALAAGWGRPVAGEAALARGERPGAGEAALASAERPVAGEAARPTITHNQLVAPEDIPRFRELGVIANTQAGFWGFKEPGWWDVVDRPFLGERALTEYPLRSFFDAGVVVASSSDHWVTAEPNPMWALRAGVTRNLNHANTYQVPEITGVDDPEWLLRPEERATVDEMIRSYTGNGAYQLGMEEEIGSIEAGKYADLVVLDRDPYRTPPLELDGIRLLYTIWNGEIVYSIRKLELDK